MLERLGGFVYRHARLVLAVTVVALACAAVLGLGAFGKLRTGGFDDPNSQSSRAAAVIDDRFGGQTNLVLLVHAPTGSVDSAAVRTAGRQLTARLTHEPNVTGVSSYWSTNAPAMKSRDGTNAVVVAHVVGDDTQVMTRTNDLLPRYVTSSGPVTVAAGGDAAVSQDITSQVGRDLAIAESIAVPITALLLVLAFGSVVAALLPLVIGLVAIVGTFAELSILGDVTDVSVFAINLTTALGLALGVDYALLLVARFREQLVAGADTASAVVTTVRTAGRTIAFSAATVVAALATLMVFPQFFLRSFAFAGMGVVAIAAVAALLVVPALLTVLGTRVNALRLPWSRVDRRGPSSPMWRRVASTVGRRPVVAALPVVAVLLLVAVPLAGVTFGTPDQRVLPAGAPSRQVADTLQDSFAGFGHAAADVVTTGPAGADSLRAYAARVSALPGVLDVSTGAGTFAHGSPVGPGMAGFGRPDAQRLSVATDLVPKSTGAADLVRAIRAIPGPGGTGTLVGGTDAEQIDATSSIGARLPLAVLLILLSTFVLLFAFTGSVVQPIRALVLNALGLSATLGAMVWIFQDGHLAGWLGFTPQPTDTSMTVLLFCVAFGLSMDYEVILTSRIKELHDGGASTSDAVTEGLARTGRIVSTAAGLLAVSFFAFGTSSVSFLQMFGLGSGMAILVDAILVRGVLVPASMALLGRLAWYAPAPLRRLHGRMALREA